jgi:hypothetical protein
MLVTQVTRGTQTFVESSLPPRPTSRMAWSTFASWKSSRATAVVESRSVHLLAVDPKALAPALQMGREEDAGGQITPPQQRLGQQRRRALSLRPGDVQDGEISLRIAQALEQRARGLQREAAVRPVRTLLDVEAPERNEAAAGAASPVDSRPDAGHCAM